MTFYCFFSVQFIARAVFPVTGSPTGDHISNTGDLLFHLMNPSGQGLVWQHCLHSPHHGFLDKIYDSSRTLCYFFQSIWQLLEIGHHQSGIAIPIPLLQRALSSGAHES